MAGMEGIDGMCAENIPASVRSALGRCWSMNPRSSCDASPRVGDIGRAIPTLCIPLRRAVATVACTASSEITGKAIAAASAALQLPSTAANSPGGAAMRDSLDEHSSRRNSRNAGGGSGVTQSAAVSARIRSAPIAALAPAPRPLGPAPPGAVARRTSREKDEAEAALAVPDSGTAWAAASVASCAPACAATSARPASARRRSRMATPIVRATRSSSHEHAAASTREDEGEDEDEEEEDEEEEDEEEEVDEEGVATDCPHSDCPASPPSPAEAELDAAAEEEETARARALQPSVWTSLNTPNPLGRLPVVSYPLALSSSLPSSPLPLSAGKLRRGLKGESSGM